MWPIFIYKLETLFYLGYCCERKNPGSNGGLVYLMPVLIQIPLKRKLYSESLSPTGNAVSQLVVL